MSGTYIIGDLEQGQEFTGCINISDFNTKGLADEVEVVPRDTESGCCPDGYTPGTKAWSGYWSSMITCGWQQDGTIKVSNSHSGGPRKCDYKKCYVVKMGVKCNDTRPMRLDGCCLDDEWTPQGPDRCEHKKYEWEFWSSSSTKQTVSYCTTYAYNYKTLGTPLRTDDQVTTDKGNYLALSVVSSYTACPGAFNETGLGVKPVLKGSVPKESYTGDATDTTEEGNKMTGDKQVDGCGNIPEFLCLGDEWDTIMCKDGSTPWAGTSCVEMERAESCGEPCPPHMKYATSSASGGVAMATCRGACFTCESQIFVKARLALGWQVGKSKLIKCKGNEFIMETDDYELPNYLSGYNAGVCSNDATSWTARYECVDGNMHYRLYPACEEKKKTDDDDETEAVFFGCKIIDGEDGADDDDGDDREGEGFFERDEVNVDFKISGLKYQEIMDDTKAALEKQIKDLLAAGIGVSQEFIDIYLSEGSVVVNAKIRASEAGIDASAVTSKATEIKPTEIVEAVKQVPGIEAAAEGGSLDSLSATAPAAEVKKVKVPAPSGSATTATPEANDEVDAASSTIIATTIGIMVAWRLLQQ
eukprot:gnl/MRDRNA2_/MRDRNA2_129539_c0_seq1.p1 gnl/MRDRNA2_/MRDRNA2_129539_c0~~gnl/MRDRNA2_/MRDRNA2_129539_c0_seq1.p1  ORF type:complete len:619 (-),score=144.30 gnl/MRDRNA2_/MRDRNA2_129539_c0_seq1:164-1921(-)